MSKYCPECEGQGWQTFERERPASFSNAEGFYEEYTDDCDNCGGSGEVEEEDDEDEDEDERGDWLMHKRQDEEMDRD